MQIKLNQVNGVDITEVFSENIVINEIQDALDLMAESNYMGAGKIILYKMNINPDFFDLKTGFAGEILQKFSNYKVKLAIIGDFSSFTSKSLRDFIHESNKHGHINFVSTIDEARERLSNN